MFDWEHGKAQVLRNKVMMSCERHHRCGPPQLESTACYYEMEGAAYLSLHNLGTHRLKLPCFIFSLFLILISKSSACFQGPASKGKDQLSAEHRSKTPMALVVERRDRRGEFSGQSGEGSPADYSPVSPEQPGKAVAQSCTSSPQGLCCVCTLRWLIKGEHLF